MPIKRKTIAVTIVGNYIKVVNTEKAFIFFTRMVQKSS